MIGAPIVAIPLIAFGVHHVKITPRLDHKSRTFDPALDHIGAADQDGRIDRFLYHCLCGADHAFILALGENDAPFGLTGRVKNASHEQRRFINLLLQTALIGVQINVALGRTRCDSGTRDRDRNAWQKARIERLGDQIFGAKSQGFTLIGLSHLGRGGFTGQPGDCFDTGQFHGIVDVIGRHVQRTPENEGKTQHVVDLIGKIRAPRGDHRTRRGLARLIRHDFGRGIGQREDDRILGHSAHEIGRQKAWPRQPQKHICAFNRAGQSGGLFGQRKHHLLRRKIGSAGMQDAIFVKNSDVFGWHAHLGQHGQAGNAGRPRAKPDNANIGGFLARNMQRV